MKNDINFEQTGLNNDGYAMNDGYILIHNYDARTGELLDSNNLFRARGQGIPANSTLIPPIGGKDGFAVCFISDKWQYLADNRGKTVYSKMTGQEQTVTELGDISDEYTLLKPQTLFDKWDGEKWQTDLVEQHQSVVETATFNKKKLDDAAKDAIVRLTDAIELDMVLDGDQEKLLAWRKYRVLLGRIDINSAPNIQWPALPE